MHPDNEQTTPVTYLHQQQHQYQHQQQQSNFALVMHRLDEHSAKLEKLDIQMKDLQSGLAAVRLDTRVQIDSLRGEMHAQFDNFRREMKADMREVVTAAMAPVNERFKTYDERLENVGMRADNRLLRWCAGSAAGSSGLAYLVSRLLS